MVVSLVADPKVVAVLQVENFLDKKQNVDYPGLAESPRFKLVGKIEPASLPAHQGVENFALETYIGHDLGVSRWELYLELYDSAVIDALLYQVDSVPLSEALGCAREDKDANRSELLEQSILKH